MEQSNVRNIREPLREFPIGDIAVTGEVIFESGNINTNKLVVRSHVQDILEEVIKSAARDLDCAWASYLVLFSTSKGGEVKCQLDVETSGTKMGYCIGFGTSPKNAF